MLRVPYLREGRHNVHLHMPQHTRSHFSSSTFKEVNEISFKLSDLCGKHLTIALAQTGRFMYISLCL